MPDRKRRGDDRLALLDRFATTYLEITDQRPLNAVYIELLSIAEYLAESSDASRFRLAFQKRHVPVGTLVESANNISTQGHRHYQRRRWSYWYIRWPSFWFGHPESSLPRSRLLF